MYYQLNETHESYAYRRHFMDGLLDIWHLLKHKESGFNDGNNNKENETVDSILPVSIRNKRIVSTEWTCNYNKYKSEKRFPD